MSRYEIKFYREAWCLYWREDGRPRRRSLGTQDRAVALRRAAEAERIEDQQKAADITVRELWSRYKASLSGRPSAITMDFEEKSLLPHFGDLTPLGINDHLVETYIETRRKAGRSDGTILNELTRLSCSLNWGVKRQLIERAPHILRPRRPAPKERYLTRAEAKRLLNAAQAWRHVHLFIVLALTTGARARAILDLKWDRVDFEKGMIDFRDRYATRPMKGRVVCPMNDSALAALKTAQALAESEFVVEWAGRAVGSVKKGVANAAKRASLEDVTPHVFRHTAAVWMAEDGVSMEQIAQLLGHSDSRITERVYARFSPTYHRKAVGALELEMV